MSNTTHTVGTLEAWTRARVALMQREKELTKLRDQLNEQRRALPWVPVERTYTFQTADGPRSLSALFGDKTQLLVYHLMFAPEWQAACKSCTFWADNFSSSLIHLAHRDVSFAAISRAPVPKLQAYAKRMGWTFPWVSSEGSSFNYDFGVSFADAQRESRERVYNFGTLPPMDSDMPGFSVFAKDDRGAVFHTYSCYARGIDMMNVTYQFLDLVPKGRDEGGAAMAWLRRRDEYDR